LAHPHPVGFVVSGARVTAVQTATDGFDPPCCQTGWSQVVQLTERSFKMNSLVNPLTQNSSLTRGVGA
jgi:hypothetical protein